MPRYVWLLLGALLLPLSAADNNQSVHAKRSNATMSKTLTEEQIEKQIEKEKKFAKEQKFYQADEYDFKGVQVDPRSVEKLEAIEPEYDFDMSEGVYSD